MFDEDKVIIAPDLNVKDLLAKGYEFDQIIERAVEKGFSKDDILYKSDAFEPKFKAMLLHDKGILEHLYAEWAEEKRRSEVRQIQGKTRNGISQQVHQPHGQAYCSQKV